MEHFIELKQEISDLKIELADKIGNLNTAISTLSVQMTGMTTQLEKQNGHVTDLCVRMNQVEQHPINCIMREKIGELEKVLQTGQHIGSVELHTKVSNVGAAIQEVREETERHLRDYARQETDRYTWKKGVLIPLVRWFAIMVAGASILLFGMHFHELIGG